MEALMLGLQEAGFPELEGFNYGSIRSKRDASGKKTKLTGEVFEELICSSSLGEVVDVESVHRQSKWEKNNRFQPDNAKFLNGIKGLLATDAWIYEGNCRSGLDQVTKNSDGTKDTRLSYAQRMANVTGHTVFSTHTKTGATATLHNLKQIENAEDKCSAKTWDRIRCYQPE